MDTVKTTAEKVSALFGDDGTTWEADCEQKLDDVCRDYGARRTFYAISDADDFDGTHYLFEDGSAIIAYVSGWDLGYAGCTCMRGAV